MGTDKKPLGAEHVIKFAFSAKTAAVVPGIDLRGPAEIAKVFKAPEKLIDGLIVIGLILILRIKQVLSSVDISQTVSEAAAFVLNGILGNFLSGAWAFEICVMWGLTKFYRDNHPAGALWLTRVLLYGGVVWFFDVHIMLYNCLRSCGSPPPVTAVRIRPGVSEPTSDYDDGRCTANSLYMSRPSEITALSQNPCRDVDCEVTPILREDHLVPKLPQIFLTEGMSLCNTHRDMYHTIRANQACSVLQCVRLGCPALRARIIAQPTWGKRFYLLRRARR